MDIGAGAGFPSLPMKIIYPQLDVTIIDSLNKRIKFLNLLADALELDKVHFYHGRAGSFLDKTRIFELTLTLLRPELSLVYKCYPNSLFPFKVGGQLLALKASAADEELKLLKML